MPGQGLVTGSGAALLPERPVRPMLITGRPALGIAYRLGAKTTIRTGAGVFYALNTGGSILVPMMSTAPYFVIANLTSSGTTPQLQLSSLFPAAGQVRSAVTTNIDLKKRDGYVYQYNFSVQRELANAMLLEAGYIGNTGHKQIGNVWLNQPMLPLDPAQASPFTARQLYPALSPAFQQVTGYQYSNYNAFYAKVEQRLKRALLYRVLHTFKVRGHDRSGQNMYNRRLERGLCDTDVPENLTASYVYDLPFGHGRAFDIRNPILNGFLGGWELSGITSLISGFPLTITTTGDIANVGTGGQRGNATGIPPEKLDPRTNGLSVSIALPIVFPLPARSAIFPATHSEVLGSTTGIRGSIRTSVFRSSGNREGSRFVPNFSTSGITRSSAE